MEVLKTLLENLKERLKTAWAEQQESELYISTKEKFDALPPLTQKGIIAGVLLLISVLFLWWPASNFLESMDFNSKFEDRRQMLKELLRIERDETSQAHVPPAPNPMTMKTQLDAKLQAAGVKPDQIRQAEMPPQKMLGANQQGIEYQLSHLTIKQTFELSSELEHTDPSFKVAGLQLSAQSDPHFYDVVIRLVNYAPKVAENSLPGKGIIDAIKNKGKTEPKNE